MNLDNYNSFNRKEETHLEKLFRILNESREEANYKPLTYPRLNKMLKELGKSKHNWDQNIYIANILDSKNPSSYFGYLYKNR